MVKKQENQPQVSPQIISAVRPTAPLLQPTPDADAKLTQLAQKMGITREEVMDKILESIPDEEQPKESFTDQSLKKIETARRLGLAGEDISDPINLKARLKIMKDMDKEEQMSMKEMLQMGLLLRILPPQDNQSQQGGGSQWQQMLTDMKAENEKQRQFYEDKLKDQENKIREMVFEKKIQALEERQAGTENNLSRQLEDLSQRVELIRSIPMNATPEMKKDAIAQLEDAGSQLERIKNTMIKFGLIPPMQTTQTTGPNAYAPPQGQEIYRNPDGSVNKTMYMIDKVTNTIQKGFESIQKKTPEKGDFSETPLLEEPEPQYTERRMSEGEYAEFLISRSSLTPEQAQWLANYRNYLIKQQAKLQPHEIQEYKPPEPVEHREVLHPSPPSSPQPIDQPVTCRLCGRPEVYQDDLCEQCWNDQRIPIPDIEEKPYLTTAQKLEMRDQPKKDIVERMREEEEARIKRTQGLM